jgi:hypothetical protein
MMNDQLFDTYRKAADSWLNMQQLLFQQSAPSSFFAAPQKTGATPEWARTVQKTWIDLTAEILNRHREAIDGFYASTIHLLQQSSRTPEAGSSEDHRRSSGAGTSKAPRATRKPHSERSKHSSRVGKH